MDLSFPISGLFFEKSEKYEKQNIKESNRTKSNQTQKTNSQLKTLHSFCFSSVRGIVRYFFILLKSSGSGQHQNCLHKKQQQTN
jgi:hypothetical protein